MKLNKADIRDIAETNEKEGKEKGKFKYGVYLN